MEKDIDQSLVTEYSARFGMVVIDMGFATIDQVLEALSEQVMDNFNNQHHRRLGEILLEKGWITSEQMEKVLEIISEHKKSAKPE